MYEFYLSLRTTNSQTQDDAPVDLEDGVKSARKKKGSDGTSPKSARGNKKDEKEKSSEKTKTMDKSGDTRLNSARGDGGGSEPGSRKESAAGQNGEAEANEGGDAESEEEDELWAYVSVLSRVYRCCTLTSVRVAGGTYGGCGGSVQNVSNKIEGLGARRGCSKAGEVWRKQTVVFVGYI
jgi:hypothetical protein